MLTRDDIPKATYFSYKYLNKLGDTELVNQDSASWLTRNGKNVEALIWNFTPLKQNEGNKAFYRKLHPAAEVAPVALRVSGMAAGRYRVKVYRTGYKANDAYSSYIEIGLPKDLNAGQLSKLKASTSDRPESEGDVTVDAKGLVDLRVSLRENDVVLVSVEKR